MSTTVSSSQASDESGRTPGGGCWVLFHDWEPWTVSHAVCVVQRFRRCRRCRKLQLKPDTYEHVWSPWELYEFTRPPRHEDEASGARGDIVVTHQRQRCLRCGFVEDHYVRNGGVGPPPPALPSPEELQRIIDAASETLPLPPRGAAPPSLPPGAA